MLLGGMGCPNADTLLEQTMTATYKQSQGLTAVESLQCQVIHMLCWQEQHPWPLHLPCLQF